MYITRLQVSIQEKTLYIFGKTIKFLVIFNTDWVNY